MEDMRNTYKILIGRLEGKRPLWRTKRKLEDNVKMDIKETGCEVVDRVHLVQDTNRCQALVNVTTSHS
jgi:hypothetical protein